MSLKTKQQLDKIIESLYIETNIPYILLKLSQCVNEDLFLNTKTQIKIKKYLEKTKEEIALFLDEDDKIDQTMMEKIFLK